MTITTLRPNGSSAGSYTVTVAATAHAALNDDLDTTYIRRTSTTSVASAIIQFGTSSISSSQKVRQVRIRVRCSTPNSTSKMQFALTTKISNVTYYTPAYSRKGVRALATYEAPWQAVPPRGGEWTQESIDSLAVQITDFATTGADRGYAYELYVDLDVANRPTTTVTAPTGTLTSTSRPDVEWTFTDSDGDPQSHYQVKIYNSTQYSAGGFSADTSTAEWDSGEIAGSQTVVNVGTYLPNATYRAYVRTAKVVQGSPFWSSWAYSGFVENVTAPTAPTITPTQSLANGYVVVSAQGAAPTGFDSQTFQIQRSTDQSTWVDIRGGSNITPNGSGLVSLNDYEAARGVTNYYRGRAIGVIGSNLYVSAWGTTASVSVTNDGTWWLKPISDPTLSVGGVGVQREFSDSIEEGLGVFRPIGRSSAIVVSSGLQGRSGTYSLVVPTAKWSAVLAVLEHRGIVYVEDPLGTGRYVRFTDRGTVTGNTVAVPIRRVTVGWVESIG